MGKNFKFFREETTTYMCKRQNSPCELRHEMHEGVEIYKVRHGKRTFCSVISISKTAVSRDAPYSFTCS